MNGSCRPTIAASAGDGRCVTALNTVIGTPSAAKATGAVLNMSVITTASSHGKPSFTSIELAIATGVPNPATPSRSALKQKPITTRTIRRSRGSEAIIQSDKASNCPDVTETLYSRSAANTIDSNGHTANAAPLLTAPNASPTGKRQGPMATTSPTKRPARDACHAGRRKAPSSARTVTIGKAATTTEGKTAPATGVND